MEVSVVIPNYNGIAFLDSVLASLEGQTLQNFEVIFVDNGSSDGSCSFVSGNYPWVHIIELAENYGFCRAVNEGIKASRAPYVLLLNNDTEVREDFLEEMVAAIKRHKRAFSCAARMVQYHDRDRLDDAGNYYNALGWSFARGKGRDIHTYEREEKIFSSCSGYAISQYAGNIVYGVAGASDVAAIQETIIHKSCILSVMFLIAMFISGLIRINPIYIRIYQP